MADRASQPKLGRAMGFLIDGFAERRARPYTEALEVLAAEWAPR